MSETAESSLSQEFYSSENTSDENKSFENMSMISEVEVQTEADQVDGIEILVQMARNGKIDAWNVDIVDVTDKYLAHLFQMKAQNLRLTGRTLLFAAILLRLKSNVLEGVDANQIEGIEEDYIDDFEIEDDGWNEEDLNTNNVVSLDEVLQRRTSIRLNRSRTVNLKDLIKQLQFYEELDRKQSLKNAFIRIKLISRVHTAVF
jgi:segregation and condensation protein A